MKTFLFTSLFFVASATMGMAQLPSPNTLPTLPTLPSFQVYADAANQTLSNPIDALGKLSTQCQAALLSVVLNPEFFTCIPIPALLPLTPVLLDPNALPEIMKDPVNKLPPLLEPVLEGLCAAPKCSDQGVATSLKAVKEGCKADADTPLIKLAIGAITFYSPVRDSVCFKTNKDEFCVFDTLKKVLSLPKPPVPITNTFFDNVAFAEPKDICTPCNKAIINTLFNYLDADTNQCKEFLASINVPVGLLPLAKLGVALKCGFQFVDGNVGHPESTDPNDFDYQLSAGQGALQSGASNLQGISLMTMFGALVSTLMFYL